MSDESDLTDAKEEFLRVLSKPLAAASLFVLCAKVEFLGSDYEKHGKVLPVGYDPTDWEAFLSFLDRRYDSGYGGQELFGTIWLSDGSWFDRGEYDGSEWWQHHKCPPFPCAEGGTQ
jgi:hypothetical protein